MAAFLHFSFLHSAAAGLCGRLPWREESFEGGSGDVQGNYTAGLVLKDWEH